MWTLKGLKGVESSITFFCYGSLTFRISALDKSDSFDAKIIDGWSSHVWMMSRLNLDWHGGRQRCLQIGAATSTSAIGTIWKIDVLQSWEGQINLNCPVSQHLLFIHISRSYLYRVQAEAAASTMAPTPESAAFLAKKPTVAPTFDGVDYDDNKALKAAQDAILREQWVQSMMARLIREELGKCYYKEGVNHLEKCGALRGQFGFFHLNGHFELSRGRACLAIATDDGS